MIADNKCDALFLIVHWVISIIHRVKPNTQPTIFRQWQSHSTRRLALVLGILATLTSGCSTLIGSERKLERGAIDVNSTNTNIYRITAQADRAYNAEDWRQASTLYRNVVEVVPNDPYAWFRLGNSLTQLGQYGQAVDAYETSLGADNAQFKAWFNLSTTHLLSAKVVTLKALRSIGMNDPSRVKVESRLDVLTALLK